MPTKPAHHASHYDPPPQPLVEQGERRPQQVQEQDQLDAFSAWLAHLEAGRIG
jgi:hypothetical protein